MCASLDGVGGDALATLAADHGTILDTVRSCGNGITPPGLWGKGDDTRLAETQAVTAHRPWRSSQ